MSIYDEARGAYHRNAFDEVRKLLEPLASQGDLEAQTALGTYLTLTGDQTSYTEGVRWLRTAADIGYGHAAHNLATALSTGGPDSPPDRTEFLKYMEIAHRSGFEASVSSDPLWWKPGN
ncbi:MAG TPA: hypothetical protein VN634_21165 [Candidatus Limnocylindrales bacterium]|jgi:TPR repeat protein|nr:hypothetical protein [Candidatus Limnocylindrales bacterium]